MELTILGQPYSKANSRRLVNRGGKPMFIKSKEALEYQESALWQLKSQVRKKMFESPVAVEMTIYYKSQRPDLDESLILDILEKAGVYKNDRLVREKHIFHGIDKDNPRAEIAIWQIEDPA
jgi:Holliday junction resolvase RusA-like endonuclease